MASGLAIGLSLLLGVAMGAYAVLLVVPVAVLASMLRGRQSVRLVAVVLVCLAVGAARGILAGEGAVIAELGDTGYATGVMSSLPVAGGEYERGTLRLEAVQDADGAWAAANGDVIVYLPVQQDGISLRDRVTVRWDATDLDELAPGYAGFVQRQGAVGSAWVYAYDIEEQGPAVFRSLAQARRAVSDALARELPGDPGALASGFVTGDDSGLQDETVEAFRRTGTAHLTSVSGQNVSLLIGFLSLWMRPRRSVSKVAVHGTMLLVVWSYATMVGLEAPAMRAAIVASLTIVGTYAGRRPDPLTLLALTVGVMALVDPQMTGSVSFWLSAVASLALCTVVATEAPDELKGKALNLCMGPLAASVATLPILIWTFHEWSPIAPLANIVLAPLVTVLFPLVYLFAGLALVPGPLASLVSWMPGIGLDLVISVVRRLEEVAPEVHLDGLGTVGIVAIAIPCVGIILSLGRDGGRWMRIVSRAW